MDTNELSPTSSPKLGRILEVGDCGTELFNNMPRVVFRLLTVLGVRADFLDPQLYFNLLSPVAARVISKGKANLI